MTTLINRVVNENLIDMKLQSMLADLSYKSTEGIKENYRSGNNPNVNLLGQLPFQANKPIDKITYDTIETYQKEMAQPVSFDAGGAPLKYLKGAFDFNIINPIYVNDAALGRPATEADIAREQLIKINFINDLTKSENDIIKIRNLLHTTNLNLTRARVPKSIAKYTTDKTKYEADLAAEITKKTNIENNLRVNKIVIDNYRNNVKDNDRID